MNITRPLVKSVWFGACFLGLLAADTARAQQMVTNPPLPPKKNGITVSREAYELRLVPEKRTRQSGTKVIDDSKVCDMYWYRQDMCADGPNHCGPWLAFDTPNFNSGGYPGSECEQPEGTEIPIGDGLKKIVKNVRTPTHTEPVMKEYSVNVTGRVAVKKPSDALKSCQDLQAQALDQALDDSNTSAFAKDLLKVSKIRVVADDNLAKAAKDEDLTYGLDFSKSGEIQLKAVLNSQGKCLGVARQGLMDEIARRAADRFPEVVKSMLTVTGVAAIPGPAQGSELTAKNLPESGTPVVQAQADLHAGGAP